MTSAQIAPACRYLLLNLLSGLLLTMASAGAGAADTAAPQHRAFDFAQDSFAYVNELE